MAKFDFSLDELKVYKPDRKEPEDFDQFWDSTLENAREKSFPPKFELVDYGLTLVDCYDVTFAGYDGQEIKAWFILPRIIKHPVPCVVQFQGYSTGRSFPFDWLLWSNAGYANLVVDTRGQGWNNKHADTPDFENQPANVQVPGFMTRGILKPETYYFRRLITDAVMAVEMIKERPEVDNTRIAVTGRSQGGGISLAVAGLSSDVSLAMPDVPFLCHFERAMEITIEFPYQELVAFCRMHRDKVDQVLDTLRYFDGINFVTRANAKAYFSVSLMDEVCPPSTVFAAYNHYWGEKQIEIYPYNEHEGGESFQVLNQLKFLKQAWPI